MSAKTSSDPRVRRSRAWLQDALRRLVQQRGYEGITVLDIAKEAQVNRTTFYQHFQDKEALMDSVMSDLLAQLFEASDRQVAQARAQGLDPAWLTPDQAPDFLRRLFEAVGQDAPFYRRAFGQDGSSRFLARMVGALEAQVLARALDPDFAQVFKPQAGPPPPPSLTARFLALGLMGSLQWWLNEGQAHAAGQAADWSWQFTYRLGNWQALAKPSA